MSLDGSGSFSLLGCNLPRVEVAPHVLLAGIKIQKAKPTSIKGDAIAGAPADVEAILKLRFSPPLRPLPSHRPATASCTVDAKKKMESKINQSIYCRQDDNAKSSGARDNGDGDGQQCKSDATRGVTPAAAETATVVLGTAAAVAAAVAATAVAVAAYLSLKRDRDAIVQRIVVQHNLGSAVVTPLSDDVALNLTNRAKARLRDLQKDRKTGPTPTG
ncbi:DNA repair protein [Nymphaea thermarum]|nr:DNA repair protein [Nymphaea thermarum]